MSDKPNDTTFGGPTRDMRAEAIFNASATTALPRNDAPRPGTNDAVAAGLHAKAVPMVNAAGNVTRPPEYK
jgi:hypothetical protein